jgi:hypothetical protein
MTRLRVFLPISFRLIIDYSLKLMSLQNMM